MKIAIDKPCLFTQKGQRETQEDSLFPSCPTEDTPYFIVCDGVGGCEHGELASAFVCEAIDKTLRGHAMQSKPLPRAEIDEALKSAYNALYVNRRISHDMATTLTFLSINSNGCTLAHLGDSRIYQIRQGEGIIFQTEDHSWVNELLKQKQITRQEAATHPQRNVITRCVCVLMKNDKIMQATINEIHDILPGDIFLLCTDGVYDEVGDENIGKLLSDSDLPLEQKTIRLAELSKDSFDNNTAYLIQVKDVRRTPKDKKENICYETSLRSTNIDYAKYLTGKIKSFLKSIR